MSEQARAVAVIGEALIDIVEAGDDDARLARPGGSPYNVALGLARLDRRTCFAGRLSTDPLGTILRNHARRSGVDLSLCVEVPAPTTVALVELDSAGTARYHFGVDGTADFGWTAAELARVPDDVSAVHFGSLASWLPPGDEAVRGRVGALREAGAVVSYDPNVRPQLQPDPAAARARVEATLPLAHLAKTSEEDLAYLRPGVDIDAVAAEWLALGATAVVVTRGGGGSVAFTAEQAVARPAVAVEVVDTVGAGDAFTSGLLAALDRHGRLTPTGLREAPWADLLDEAAEVAAITCARAGANPPRTRELPRGPGTARH